jgi:hypothetical protein
MARRKGITDKQVREAMKRHGGRVTDSAWELGISPQALHVRLYSKPELYKKEINRANMAWTLDAMQGLIRQICAGNPWAIKYYLQTYCAEYGWTTKDRGENPPLTEERCLELIPALSGDVQVFKAHRIRLAGTGPISGQKRRRVIERAAAAALGTTPKDAWIFLVTIDALIREANAKEASKAEVSEPKGHSVAATT